MVKMVISYGKTIRMTLLTLSQIIDVSRAYTYTSEIGGSVTSVIRPPCGSPWLRIDQMMGHRERLIDGDEFDAFTRNGRRADRFRSRERRIVKRKVARRSGQSGQALARGHI